MKITTLIVSASLAMTAVATGWAAEVKAPTSTELQSIMRTLPPSAQQALVQGKPEQVLQSLSPAQVQRVSKELQQLQKLQHAKVGGVHLAANETTSKSIPDFSSLPASLRQAPMSTAATNKPLQVQNPAVALSPEQMRQLRQITPEQRQKMQQMAQGVVYQPSAQSSSRTSNLGPQFSPAEASFGQQWNGLHAAQENTASASPERRAALQNIMSQSLPLTPEEIAMLRLRYNQTQSVATQRFSTPPKPTSTSQIVKVSPGAPSPMIRLSQGFVTSLVFVDSTGAPWPIEAYDLGDPKAVNINWDRKSHIMMMQATTLYAYANMAIKLHNLDTPLVVTLIPGQHVVDYIATLRVQGRGPNAKPLMISDSLAGKTNPLLLGVLDGVAPSGSEELTIEGGEAEAWLVHNRIYLRTRMTVLSPGWVATLSSPDGTHAYEMPKTPTILVSRYGKFVQLKVKGY